MYGDERRISDRLGKLRDAWEDVEERAKNVDDEVAKREAKSALDRLKEDERKFEENAEGFAEDWVEE